MNACCLQKNSQVQSSSPEPFFTVYQTAAAIELRAGCHHDSETVRVISTSRAYEDARMMAEIAARNHKLILMDYVNPPHRQN